MKSPFEKIYRIGAGLYDRIDAFWHKHYTRRWISRLLAYVFLISLLLGVLVHEQIIPAKGFFAYFKNPFVAIEITFTVLLVVELFDLIFSIPVSVSQSVIKQFELLSLIFIRMGLKEFSHLHKLFDWDEMQHIVLSMFIYGFGALFIFMFLGLHQKLKQRLQIREYFREYPYYKRVKKNIALILIGIFIGIVGYNFAVFLNGKEPDLSFKQFYTALIFSDILVLVISMRYILDYHSMFRYSGYILTTIFIRIALTAAPYYNIIIGLGAVIYLILLTETYTFFMNRKITKKPRYLRYNAKEKTFAVTHGKSYRT
jgi:MFS family permease